MKYPTREQLYALNELGKAIEQEIVVFVSYYDAIELRDKFSNLSLRVWSNPTIWGEPSMKIPPFGGEQFNDYFKGN